ncbi:hypothetical protein TNCV_3813121 [Trichonephila clavipes]|nr:hypothetical protein TNCV_3813121 [Trichonephila clavipes]
MWFFGGNPLERAFLGDSEGKKLPGPSRRDLSESAKRFSMGPSVREHYFFIVGEKMKKTFSKLLRITFSPVSPYAADPKEYIFRTSDDDLQEYVIYIEIRPAVRETDPDWGDVLVPRPFFRTNEDSLISFFSKSWTTLDLPFVSVVLSLRVCSL